MACDWAPLTKSSIGFERIFSTLDTVHRSAQEPYPPYNIERFEDGRFQISIALAGFGPDEIALVVERDILTIEGVKAEEEALEYIHRGILARSFKRLFTIADGVDVRMARFKSGLLVIDLACRPTKAAHLRKIEIFCADEGEDWAIDAGR
jgi:molecular chaperone IbpA